MPLRDPAAEIELAAAKWGPQIPLAIIAVPWFHPPAPYFAHTNGLNLPFSSFITESNTATIITI